MSKQKAESVTPETVDDMTDEQVTEFMQSQGEDLPEVDDQQAAQQAKAAVDEKSVEEAGDDTEKQAEKAETVDFKRYDYERNRRRKAEEEREREKAEWARRFDELLKSTKAEKPGDQPKIEIPDENENPVETIAWLKKQISDMAAARDQETNEQKQAREREAFTAQIVDQAGAEFSQAVQADPTLGQAYQSLIESFKREAAMYRMTPVQTERFLYDSEVQHLMYARQNRIDLSDYIKGLATARGWAPQAVQQQEQGKQNAADAQRKAKSLSNGGGSPGVSDSITAEQLLGMSDADFDAFVAKHGSLSAGLSAH